MDQDISNFQKILSEINITQNPDELTKQMFANPLLYKELNLTDRVAPDYVFDKTFFNENTSLNTLGDNQFQFVISSPHPVKLSSIYFKMQIRINGLPEDTDANQKVNLLPNFFNTLFSCIDVQIGQNTLSIDHLGTYNDIWGYVFKELEIDSEYQNHLGYIDGMIRDSPNQHQFTAGILSDGGMKARNSVLLEARTNEANANNTAKVRGIMQPPNFFFQKDKFLPPFVPLRFNMTKNPLTAVIKQGTPSNLSITWESIQICYISCQLRSGIYDKFRDMYTKSLTRFPAAELPQNPYASPEAIYQYFDIKASIYPIAQNMVNVLQPIRFTAQIPKGIIFCLGRYTKNQPQFNHLEFSTHNLKSYSVLLNSQPLVPCTVCSYGDDVNNTYQDMYLRLRNFLGHMLLNETTGLSYPAFKGGTAIFAELLNPSNNLNINSRQDVGNLELQLVFNNPNNYVIQLYTFLIYDQMLIIDKEFNAHQIVSV